MKDNIYNQRVDYSKNLPLEESELPDNPFELFHGWYEVALDKVAVDPNAMILSTLKGNQPRGRVVLLKNLDNRGFTYFTNYESDKAKEKYLVTEKISHGTKEGFIDSSRIVLCKSSLNNAMGFMDVSLTKNAESVIVDRYSFIHSFIHNIYAPGKIILENKKRWTEKAPSNLFMDYTKIHL